MSELIRSSEGSAAVGHHLSFKRPEDTGNSARTVPDSPYKPSSLSHSVEEILSINNQSYGEEDDYQTPREYLSYQQRYPQEYQPQDSKDSTGFSIHEILGIAQQYGSQDDMAVKLEYSHENPISGESDPKLLMTPDYTPPTPRTTEILYSTNPSSSPTYGGYGDYVTFPQFSNAYSSNSFTVHQPRHVGGLSVYYDHVSFVRSIVAIV